MTKDNIEKLYEQAAQRAKNNKERQAFIHPSEFGFEHSMDGTRACLNLLKADSRFRTVGVIGKDSLDITLY